MKCKLTRKLVAEVPTNNQPRNCEGGRKGKHASRHNIYNETGKNTFILLYKCSNVSFDAVAQTITHDD